MKPPIDYNEICMYLENDEGLYNWWKSSRLSKTRFIKENRKEIVAAIRSALAR